MSGRRIALFVDRFPVVSETFVAGEADALAALGARVRIEAHAAAEQPDPAAAARWPAHRIDDAGPAERAAALLWVLARHPGRSLADLRSRRRWRREEWPLPLRQLAPVAWRVARAGDEHLHAHFAAGAALSALRVAALLELPWSVTVHGYDLFLQPRNLPEKLARARFATTGSTFTLTHLQRTYGPALTARTHRIVMGVDPERFVRPADAPVATAPVLVAVGRLVSKKGFATLLDAVAALPDARLVLIGDGPLRAELTDRVAALGLAERVELTGALPTAAVRARLLEAAVVVVPAVISPDGDADSMPVIAKEALALEIPVVASDVAGLPEVVRPPWGRTVPPGDAASLARVLGELLALRPTERAAMGAAGRAWVREHADLRDQTARLLRLIG